MQGIAEKMEDFTISGGAWIFTPLLVFSLRSLSAIGHLTNNGAPIQNKNRGLRPGSLF